MKHEKSCGVIPIIKSNEGLKVVLIKQNNGVIGFPKGHVEHNETEEETALRECFEETNLKVKILFGFKEEIFYYMPEYNAYKTVVFFIGIVDNLDLKKQVKEISDIFITKIEDSLDLISFEDTKKLLIKAKEFISGLK